MKMAKLILLIFITIGALIGSVGQVLYGIDSLFSLFAFGGVAVIALTNIVSATSTLFIRAETRVPALKKIMTKTQMSANENQQKVSKILVAIVGTSAIITGIAGTASAYLGGQVVADIFHIANEYVLISFGVYAALGSFIATFAFFGQSAIDNCKKISVFLNDKESRVTQNKYTIAKNIVKTVLVAGLGAVTFSSFSLFTLTGTLKLFTDDMGIIIPLALLGAGATLISTIFSRVIDTYQYFSSQDELDSKPKTSWAKKALISPLLALGYLDVLVFDAVMVSSCLNNASLFGIDPTSPSVIILSLFPATSAAAMHYIFSVEKVNKKYRQMTVIDERDEEKAINTSTTGLTSLTNLSNVEPREQYDQLIDDDTVINIQFNNNVTIVNQTSVLNNVKTLFNSPREKIFSTSIQAVEEEAINDQNIYNIKTYLY